MYKNNINYIITWYDNTFKESHRINIKGNKVEKLLSDLNKIDRYINISVKSLERKNTLELLIDKLNNKFLISGNKYCDYINIIIKCIKLEISCKDGIYLVKMYDLTEGQEGYYNKKHYKTVNGVIRFIESI